MDPDEALKYGIIDSVITRTETGEKRERNERREGSPLQLLRHRPVGAIKLIAGPGVYICDECTRTAYNLIFSVGEIPKPVSAARKPNC